MVRRVHPTSPMDALRPTADNPDSMKTGSLRHLRPRLIGSHRTSLNVRHAQVTVLACLLAGGCYGDLNKRPVTTLDGSRSDGGTDVALDSPGPSDALTTPPINLAPVVDTGGVTETAPVIDTTSTTCPVGYTGSPPSCADIDECATSNGGCSANATCANKPGSRVCTCVATFKGDGVTCKNDDASLKALTVSPGTLGPPFVSDTMSYSVALPSRTSSATITATANKPAGTTIKIAGSAVASGATSSQLAMGLGRNTVKVEVTAESGTTVSYTVVLQRSVKLEGQSKSTPTSIDASFGSSIAASGDYVAIGAPRESDFTGAVYIFRRENGAWIQSAAIKAPNSQQYDSFGWSVALSGDLLVVGAATESGETKGSSASPPSDVNGAPGSGAVYAFRRSGDTWPLEAYLKPSDNAAGSRFGSAVAIQGENVAIGAPWQSGFGEQPRQVQRTCSSTLREAAGCRRLAHFTRAMLQPRITSAMRWQSARISSQLERLQKHRARPRRPGPSISFAVMAPPGSQAARNSRLQTQGCSTTSVRHSLGPATELSW